jgi:mannose-6-phosphate isomerase-like protein (cupin superfamily)
MVKAMRARAPVLGKIKGAGRFQRLLDSASESLRLKSGSVCLPPGESVGFHVTEGKEEFIIILKGKAKIQCEGSKVLYGSRQSFVYIPPCVSHNLTNVGRTVLQYVYVVCPVSLST